MSSMHSTRNNEVILYTLMGRIMIIRQIFGALQYSIHGTQDSAVDHTTPNEFQARQSFSV